MIRKVLQGGEKPFDDELMLSPIRIALNQHNKLGYRKADVIEIQVKLQSLSLRERQVLDGLLVGDASAMIACGLNLGIRKVEVHRANIMAKMDATSLSLLVRKAMVAGLLPSA